MLSIMDRQGYKLKEEFVKALQAEAAVGGGGSSQKTAVRVLKWA